MSEQQDAEPPADQAVFEWPPDDMGPKPADWQAANPALEFPAQLDRMRELLLDGKFELTSWQQDLLAQLYSDPDAFDHRLSSVITGQMWHAPVGTPPPIKPRRAPRRCWGDWVYVDEIVEWTTRPSKVNEARQRLIDEISDDVEARIARLQCPRFPRADA